MPSPADKYREDLLYEIATDSYIYGPSEYLDLLNEEYERVKVVDNANQNQT